MDRRVTSKLLPRFPRETAFAPGSLSRWSKKTKNLWKMQVLSKWNHSSLGCHIACSPFQCTRQQASNVKVHFWKKDSRLQRDPPSSCLPWLFSVTYWKHTPEWQRRPHVIAACNTVFARPRVRFNFQPKISVWQKSKHDNSISSSAISCIIHHQPRASLYQPSRHPNKIQINLLILSIWQAFPQPTHLPCCRCAVPQVLLTKALQLWVSALHASALPVQSSAFLDLRKH